MKHHSKGVEKSPLPMIFSKTSTETLPSKNPKNLKNNPKTWFVNEKICNKYSILSVVEKVLKSVIQ